jgi:hypothetical protein
LALLNIRLAVALYSGADDMKPANSKSEALGDGAAEQAAADPILQVRELLFGADKRATDSRLADLDAKLEKMIGELRADMAQKFSEMESHVENLTRDVETRRLTSIDDIGAAISGLGATIRNMGAGAKAR